MSAASKLPLIGWLFPDPDEPGAAISRRTQLQLVVSLTVANLVGTAVVLVLLGLVLPTPEVASETDTIVVNLVAAGIYVLFGLVFGTWWGMRRLRGLRHWLRSDRAATADEQLRVLRAPYSIVRVHAFLWGLGAVGFGILNWTYDPELGRRVLLTVALGGLTTCAIAYLVTERILRPAAARALAEGGGEQTVAPGVKARAFLAWVLGPAIPMVGLILIASSTLVEGDFDADELALAAIALCGVGLVMGLYITILAARAVADPIKGLRTAVAEVERGDLEAEVQVYDGSEVGQLQAGFNRMVAGLRERERIHDLFGRHVGEDVAKAALEAEVEMGGETRSVSILFVDMVGSTTLASERPPQEVVDTLNRFFAVVVEVVREHGGWVNKFEGDAALAVFGAPVPVADHADCALAAARELRRRLAEASDYEAGIGVSSGEVVAGNIGEARRFEYTVIGDPVNEAARLTELAKSEGGVLASDAALAAAGPDEAANWVAGDEVELRGRSKPTRPARPAPDPIS